MLPFVSTRKRTRTRRSSPSNSRLRSENQPNNYAAIAYEGIKLVAEGMKAAGGDDPQKIGEYLLTVKDVEGTLGTMSFLPNRVIEFPYYEWIIKDGAVTPLT